MSDLAVITDREMSLYKEIIKLHERIPLENKELTPSQAKKIVKNKRLIKAFKGSIPTQYQIYIDTSIHVDEKNLVLKIWNILNENETFQKISYEKKTNDIEVINLEIGNHQFTKVGTINHSVTEHLQRIGLEKVVTVKLTSITYYYEDSNQFAPSGFCFYLDVLGPSLHKKLFEKTKRIDQHQINFIRFFEIKYKGFYKNEAKKIIDEYMLSIDKISLKKWEFFNQLKEYYSDFLHPSNRIYLDDKGNSQEYQLIYQKMVSTRVCFPPEVKYAYLWEIIDELYFDAFPTLESKPYEGKKVQSLDLIDWSPDYKEKYFNKLKMKVAPVILAFQNIIEVFERKNFNK